MMLDMETTASLPGRWHTTLGDWAGETGLTAEGYVFLGEVTDLVVFDDDLRDVTDDPGLVAALDVARDALVNEANRIADEGYERRMSCRRPTRDCGCRTCGG